MNQESQDTLYVVKGGEAPSFHVGGAEAQYT